MKPKRDSINTINSRESHGESFEKIELPRIDLLIGRNNDSQISLQIEMASKSSEGIPESDSIRPISPATSGQSINLRISPKTNNKSGMQKSSSQKAMAEFNFPNNLSEY